LDILHIAWKEIKHDFRDIRTLVFMILFPIILMLVLGTALTGAFEGGDFDKSLELDDMNILYDNANDNMSQPLEEFTSEAEESGLYFKPIYNKSNGQKQVEEGKVDAYVSIDKDNVELYLNDRNSIKGNIIQGTLASFVDKYNLISEVITVAPEKAEAALTQTPKHDYIDEKSILPDENPGSMDYYAIVMTTMIALYAAISACHLIIHERSRNTANRLMVAPIHKRDIFIGKVLGSVVINMVCIIAVVAFSRFVFDANWGDNWGIVFLILLTEVILAISFGLGVSFLFKSTSGPAPIIIIIIQIVSFFGGAYFPVDEAKGFMKILTNLSPLTLENNALFQMIYANDFSYVIPAVGMNIGVAALFLLITIVSLRRREGL